MAHHIISVPIFQYAKEIFGAFLSQVYVIKRSSPAAYRAYERKAAHDFYSRTKVKLKKSERLSQAALRCLDGCTTVDEALEKLRNISDDFLDEYLVRLAHIWLYYEVIDK